MSDRTQKLTAVLLLWVVTVLATPMMGWAEDARLAIIATDRTLDPEADQLAVTLSHQAGVALLERGEINRVLGEQARTLSTAADCLRLGQMLRADGVIALRRVRVQQQELLVADLVAVGLGYRVDMIAERYPTASTDKWVENIRDRFVPLLGKLGVKPGDAIPVSLLNLRAAAGTTEAKLLERNLTFLLTARLVRESRIFVLERQHLSALEFDKKFVGDTQQAGWTTARFVVDGELLPGGADPDSINLQLRIEPPQNRQGTNLNFRGSKGQIGVLVDQMAAGILSALGQPSRESAWQAQAEAERFRREAFSAEQAGLEEEALAAGEASYALGSRSDELKALIARQSYLKAFSIRGGLSFGYSRAQVKPETLDIGLIQHAVDLSNSQATNLSRLEVLLTAGRVIRYYHESGGYAAHREALDTLREQLQQTVRLAIDQNVGRLSADFWGVLASYAPYLYDDPGQVISTYRLVLDVKQFTTPRGWITTQAAQARHFLTEARDTPLPFGRQSERTPWLVAWRNESPETLNRIWEAFLQELSDSTNLNERLDGLLLRAYSVEAGTALSAVEDQIQEALWNARTAITEDAVTYTIAIQLLRSLSGDNEAFRFKFLDYYFREAKFYNWLVLEYGLIWRNGRGGSGFSTPALRSKLLESMDVYARRMNGRPDFQAPQFEQYRQRLVVPGAGSTGVDSTDAFALTKHWLPGDLEAPRRGAKYSEVRKVVYRDSQVWVLERTATMGSQTPIPIRIRIFQVDPKTLAATSLEVPMLGPTTNSQRFDVDYDFEVSPDHIFVATQGKLLRYDRAAKSWNSTEVPSSDFPALTLLDNALYYTFPGVIGRQLKPMPASGIVRINPQTLEQHVMASSRRKQPATLLDDVPVYRVPSLIKSPQGTLHAIVIGNDTQMISPAGDGVKVYAYNEATGNWTQTFVGEFMNIRSPRALLAFADAGGAVFQRLESPSQRARFSASRLGPDGHLQPLIFPADSTNTLHYPPWRAPENPWTFGATPATQLIASKDGTTYWVLLKDQKNPNTSLALYQYQPGRENPTVLPLAFADVPIKVYNTDPSLIATPEGLLLVNLGGAAFWLVPWEELGSGAK